MKQKPSPLYAATLLSVALLFALGLLDVSNLASGRGVTAQVISAFSREKNPYSIALSKTVPGVFTFNYQYAKTKSKKGQANFDLPIMPFDEKLAERSLPPGVNFGPHRDAWGYPVRENAYQKIALGKSPKERTALQPKIAFAADPGTVPGLMNCRANTSVTGYFEAYFEDVALDTNVGYDDPTKGAARRAEVCQVLQDIAALIKLDQTTVTPDILFMVNPGNIPPGALAAASAYFGYYTTGPDNGSLHKHIISRQDPTPNTGSFDAFIITNFNGISWDVDSSLNTNTYDFYTVIYHEVLHTLGFRSLLPAVIGSTNSAVPHTSLDSYIYKDSTLANSFFNAVSEFLQVPTGAPSAWFISNAAVYRGNKNVYNVYGGIVAPDGLRPIYSPISWEQGSSLSHFDMTRANGKVYVMNPSIGLNTTRTIHVDEKEVLCHIGYQIAGMTDCELPTPVAVDDIVTLPGGTTPFCINFLTNDYSLNINGTLVAYDISFTGILPGDNVIYYTNGNCTGSVWPTVEGAARSLLFTPANNTARRQLTYSVFDSISWRISNEAKIVIRGCSDDPEDYVCNGGFETGTSGFLGSGSFNQPYYYVDFWRALYGTPDWAGYYGSVYSSFIYFAFPHVCAFSGCLITTPDGSQRAAWMLKMKDHGEGIATTLKQPLVLGQQYQISFDVFAHVANDADVSMGGISYNPNAVTSANIIVKARNGVATVTPDYLNNDSLLPSFNQTILNQSVPLTPQNNWTHVESVFTANSNYDYIGVIPEIIQNAPEDQWVVFYVDNVSLKEYIPPKNVISGLVYVDQNANSSYNVNETKLDGIQLGLFAQGSNTPLQTISTKNVPHLGEYVFENVPDGYYRIAILSESLYPSITEPATNNPVILSGYSHAKSVTVSGNQINSNNNFGVILNGTAVDVCPNISGSQSSLPAGYQFFGTQCDACTNIDGVQSSVPNGYTNVSGQCIQNTTDTTSVTDICPNISGVQTTVPTGYVLVLGKCIVEPTAKDVCPNINGVQSSVPKGYVIDKKGNCVAISYAPTSVSDSSVRN